jgi:prepilin-type N-terminal cleavage/methylation domain-containing protein
MHGGARSTERTAIAGFTLVELLIVMSLIAVLLGLGLGVFAKLDLGDRVAASSVQNVIRAAHNWSIAQGTGARVRIDASAGTIRSEGFLPVGTWHFESEPFQGAFDIQGASAGGHLVENGFEGHALSFDGETGRPHVVFAVKQDSSWTFTEGFAIRCAVRMSGHEGGSLLDLGGAVGIETTSDGAIKAWFVAQRSDDEQAQGRGGRVAMGTNAGLLAPNRWAQIAVEYDRRAFTILVDGQPATRLAETAPVVKLEGDLVLSPSQTAFPGDIDNLVVASLTSGDVTQLTPGIGFTKETPAVIAFEAGGGLDRSVHTSDVKVGLDFGDGRKETVLVNLFGTVE